MKKSVSFKFNDDTIQMLEELSNDLHVAKGNILENLVHEHYKIIKRIETPIEFKSEMMDFDGKLFKVLVKKKLIMGRRTVLEKIVMVMANEIIDTENHFYKKNEVIFNGDSGNDK